MKFKTDIFCSDELELDKKDIEKLLSGKILKVPGMNVRLKASGKKK